MEPHRLEATVAAALFAATPVIISAAVVTVSSRAATGRLLRNPRAGFRTSATLRSDQAWVAAHRAALQLKPLYLLVTAITWAALSAAAVYALTPGVIVPVGLGTAAALTALVIYTAFIAGKAAKSAEGEASHKAPDGG